MQGEYVAAEKIEMALSKSQYIGQLWIYGNSFYSMLVGVVVPAVEALRVHAKAHGWPEVDDEALCALPQTLELIKAEIKAQGAAFKLKSFELPKDLFVESRLDDLKQVSSLPDHPQTPPYPTSPYPPPARPYSPPPPPPSPPPPPPPYPTLPPLAPYPSS